MSPSTKTTVLAVVAALLLALNLVLLVAGMIMDVPVALALLVPLLAPVAVAQGADPLHLGIVICFNLCITFKEPFIVNIFL